MTENSENTYESSDKKYEALFSNMFNGFALHKIITNEKGEPINYEFVEVNSAFEDLMGLEKKDIIGKKVTELIPGIEKDSVKWISIYGEVALSGKKIKFENYSKTLKKWFDISAYSPAKYYFATIFDDITEQKKLDYDISNSHMLLHRIINILPIRVFWKDKSLIYLGCNNLFAKDAGESKPENIIGKNDFEMSWHEQAKKYRDDDLEVMNSKIPKLDFEEQQTTPTGSKIWLKTSKIPLTDSQGDIIGILGIYEDITSVKNNIDDLLTSKTELQLKVNELEKFNELTINRELKMIELKTQIKELEKNLHELSIKK